MKINNEEEKIIAQKEAIEILENAENKSEAIVEVVEKLNAAEHANLIAEITLEAANAEADKDFAEKLGLRKLNATETKFYESLKANQSITAEQIDIIPTTIIDRTLENIKQESGILSLIDFTPADVKKWVVADKTGSFSWTGLTDAIKTQLNATITGLNIDVNKLSVAMVIPKAIADLALPFVDKYFTAILKETINDGAEYGFLNGTGKDEPIGIYNHISSLNENGTHKAKTLNDLTGFSPKELAPMKVALTNDGKRVVTNIALICNPADKANYVDPAMLDEQGNNVSSDKNITVYQSANNEQGKAIFFLPKKYVMGFSGFNVNEYKETKAMDDANLIIAKAYGNGRAVDDNVAYPIDVTKLKEFIRKVKTLVEDRVEDGVEGA